MAAKRSAKKTRSKGKAPAKKAASMPEPRDIPETQPAPEVPVPPEAVNEPVAMQALEISAAPEPVSVPAMAEKLDAIAEPEPARKPAPAAVPVSVKKPDAAHTKDKNFEVVVFTLEKEQFAINLFDVKEVVEYSTITKLPNVPSYIQGIIDLRGEITTIIDLRSRLSLNAGSGEMTENSRIIVLDTEVTRIKTGILVDDVTSVSTFGTSQVDYASGAMNNEDTAILGIIKKKVKVADKETSELIIWLDIRKLIEDIEAA